MPTDQEPLRLDKYLWSVRLYKTRSNASDACSAGKVKMGEQVLKASHVVRVGERYELSIEQVHKVIEVKALLHNRVAAKLEITKHITCHVARHTYACYCLRHGVRIEAVKRTLGHRKLETTQIYARLVDKDVLDSFNNAKINKL